MKDDSYSTARPRTFRNRFYSNRLEETLASDRRVHPKAKDKVNLLAKRAKIYILTKGKKEDVDEVLRKVKAEIALFNGGRIFQREIDLLRQLGGNPDGCHRKWSRWRPMMEEAVFGLCCHRQGRASAEAVKNADVVFTDIWMPSIFC